MAVEDEASQGRGVIDVLIGRGADTTGEDAVAALTGCCS